MINALHLLRNGLSRRMPVLIVLFEAQRSRFTLGQPSVQQNWHKTVSCFFPLWLSFKSQILKPFNEYSQFLRCSFKALSISYELISISVMDFFGSDSQVHFLRDMEVFRFISYLSVFTTFYPILIFLCYLALSLRGEWGSLLRFYPITAQPVKLLAILRKEEKRNTQRTVLIVRSKSTNLISF